MQAEFFNDIGPTSETMETCERSQVSQLGCLPPASLVSPQALQESDRARQMTAGSGRRLLPLLKTVHTNGSCLRILLESCLSTTDWNSSVSVLRWKAKATKYNRLLFQLAPLGRRTGVIESGLLPTATQKDSTNRGYQYDQGDKSKPRLSLAGMARLQPTARNSDGMKHKLRTHLPANHNYRGRLEDLVAALSETSGYLNPIFVAWWMGYPLTWWQLSGPSETVSSLKFPSRLSKEPQVKQTRKKRTTKSAKALSLENVIKSSHEAKSEAPLVLDGTPCTAKVPGLDVVCGETADRLIHDPNGGYAGYHPFESSAPVVEKKSRRRGATASSTPSTETNLENALAAGAGGD